jgi:hypothetical protein
MGDGRILLDSFRKGLDSTFKVGDGSDKVHSGIRINIRLTQLLNNLPPMDHCPQVLGQHTALCNAGLSIKDNVNFNRIGH